MWKDADLEGNIVYERLEEQMERRSGEDRYFWWKGEWRTKSSFFGLVESMEEELKKAGFAPCQRIGSLLPNSPAFLALCVATWRLGGCVAPLNFLAGPGATLRNVQRAELFSVVVPDFAKPQLDLLQEKAGDFPYSVANLEGEFSLCRGKKQDLVNPEEDHAVIFFTSGTTGNPKVVPLTHRNISSNVQAASEHVPGLRGGKVMFNVLPNFHAFGFTVASILPLLVPHMGEVLMPSFMPPENTLKVLQETRSTALVAVPTMISMLIGAAAKYKPDLSALELLVSGGDRFPLRLDEKMPASSGAGGTGGIWSYRNLSCGERESHLRAQETGYRGNPSPGLRSGGPRRGGKPGLSGGRGGSLAPGAQRGPGISGGTRAYGRTFPKWMVQHRGRGTS